MKCSFFLMAGLQQSTFCLTWVSVGSRLSAFYCDVGMARRRRAGDTASLPFSPALVKGNVFLMSLSQGVWPFR